MNIKKMSDISGINIETIRSYRKSGYLLPAQKENGYYDYSDQDLITLFWIRKLRGYNMSMNNIHEYFYSHDHETLLQLLEEKKAYLEKEIFSLHEAMRFIDLETRHIRETTSEKRMGAEVLQSIDDKIDIYPISNRDGHLKELYFCMTPTVHITKEILNGPMEDRCIPIKVGVGTYRYILEEHHLEFPENAVIVPNGLNIVQELIIRDFTKIHLSKLTPMMSFAKANGLTFQSDTTGYLMRIRFNDGIPSFHFRVRATFELNDIKDPSVLAKYPRK